MYQTNTEYDHNVSSYNPQGRLFQIEYARKAIALGSTAIGIKTSEGVILAVEKRLKSPLIIPSSVEKIIEIDKHLGCAMSGLVADARILVEKARVEAQNHIFTYNEPIQSKSIAQSISDVCIGFGKGEDMPSRPFGVALLVAGADIHGPQLYHITPEGTFSEWKAKAIGAGSEGAQSELQNEYRNDLSLDEGMKLALNTLKQVMEDKINDTNIEVATVTPEKGYRVLPVAEIKDIIESL
jgi:20S proteasome subunit alpha 5